MAFLDLFLTVRYGTFYGILDIWFFELLFTLPIFIQSLGQLFAMFAIPLKNNPVPSVSNYKSDIQYSLPFKGKWTVVNGGVDKELSHSWSINAQRYAYDFIKLDDKLKSYNGDKKN